MNSQFRFVFVIFLFLVPLVFGLSGCAGVPSVKGFPTERPLQVDRTITVNYTFEDVFDAIKEAAIRVNLSVQREDFDGGYIFVNGFGSSRGQGYYVAYAFYIKEISDKPKTQVDIVSKMPGFYLKSERRKSMDVYVAELNKVLLSYD